MTEDRLREIAFAMEEPLRRLDELNNLLIVMVDQCRTDLGRRSNIYMFFEHNLGPNLDELRKLWREFCSLTGVDADKPPLKAIEE